jgi:hypothetical protein
VCATGVEAAWAGALKPGFAMQVEHLITEFLGKVEVNFRSSTHDSRGTARTS